MPTILRVKGYRFFFYSNEGFEPCHIHVIRYAGEAKFWIPSCEIVWSYNFNSRQLKKILEIVKDKIKLIEDAWNEYFNK